MNRMSLPDKFKINISNYKVINKLKSGSYGSVYIVLDQKTFQQYAAKVLYTDDDKIQYQKLINREVEIMMRVQHPTIIRLHGYSLTDFDGLNNVTILMDLAEYGSLSDLIKKPVSFQNSIDYDNTARQIILVGVARGMMYLHKHNVIHRDLKPDNVLLDSYLHPHITDFGLSKFFQTGHSKEQSQACGTTLYEAPEIIKTATKYDCKADVYSFGILMYEVLTQQHPFPLYEKGELTEYELNQKIVNEGYRPEFTVPVKPSLKLLTEECWAQDPEQRPTFEEIFNKLGFNRDIKEHFDIFNEDDVQDYYLDNIDVDELLSYIDEIEENDAFTNDLSKKVIQKIRNQLTHQEQTFKNILQSIITIDGFNNINLESQHLIISEIMKESRNSSYLSNINDLIIYLLNFDRSMDASNGFFYLQIPTDRVEERMFNIKEGIKNINRVHILSNATELLYENNSLNSHEFIKLLNNFSEVSIQLKYPSEYFEPIYDIVLSLKKRQIGKLKITIFIFGIGSIDEVFHNNQYITSVQMDFFIQQIGPRAFAKCSSLTNVTLPSSIISIGDESFQGCSSLLEAVIPSSVNSLGDSSFEGCSSLKTTTIPSSVTSIGKNAFSGCTSLTQILIPSSISVISNFCFTDCSSLTLVKIPQSVTSIGDSAFKGCSALTCITIPTTVTSIGSSAFSGCTSLSQISIPPTIKSIGDSTFLGCSSLTQIVIPSSVTSIGEGAFLRCTLLTQVTLPSITSIKKQTFRQCSSLKRITIPKATTSIESFAFAGCSSLTQVRIPSNVTSIGDYAFDGCSMLLQVFLPSSVTTIGNSVFTGCLSLTEVSIPSSVKSIGNHLFSGCSSLTTVSLPPEIDSIGKYTFSGCISLTDVSIPNTVKSIDDYAFSGCSSLKKLIIPSSVNSIGSYAFSGCVSLIQMPIPDSVDYVGENAFKDVKIHKNIEF